MADPSTPVRPSASSATLRFLELKEDGERMETSTEPVTEAVLKETSLTKTTTNDRANDSVLQLNQIRPQLEKDFSDLAFVAGFSSRDNQPMLTVTQREMHYHPPFGYTSRIHLVIKGNEYVANVLGVVMQSGSVSTGEEVHELCKMFSGQSSYKFCPGIEWDLYEEQYHSVIRYHKKPVRYSSTPYQRVDSVNCARWYKLPSNAPLTDKFAKEVMCPACKAMKNRLNSQRKITMSESPSKKTKRQAPSSKAKLSYMSPASQSKRKQNALTERNNDKRKLTKYEKTEVTLADEQHEEMCAIMNKVEEVDKAELEKIFAEGDSHGVGTQIREVWMTDRRQQLAQFKADQDRNATGKQSNQWSMVTIRIALAIFTRSPAAYEALKSFKILQLPSRSTLQAYTGTFLHEAGVSTQCIADQVAQYIVFKAECEKQGKCKPQSDGVIIFDEVKVACQLVWNSRNHKLSGLAMTNKDMSSLNDIYRVLKEPDSPGQTSYILQFLWRDLTSSYDIVGPYFTLKESVDAQFILSCVLETVKLFQTCGLRTSLIVCDGSPTTIKFSHGHSGAYSVTSDSASNDIYEVKPWIVNPFNPPWPIYWMICPTHQLKNMINALFSSKSGGTKQFKRGQHHVGFGWDSIIAMYQREVGRAKQNLTRMVPRLKEIHVVRDSWTKLNVSPAKIMQQEQVLGELFWYSNLDPPPLDSSAANETWEYLQACHKLFEIGFLSHDKVVNMDSPMLNNINDGYKYFTLWLSTLLEQDSDYPHLSSNQKSFLSWQTWDLLRIDVYSFRAFCKHFFEKHPGYFVSPLRISGSAVESLFSQFKHNAGGKLDSCNYVTARCAHLVQQCASGHHSGVGYRDEILTYMELPLHKKSYGNS